ncbi:hypothetical protein [Flaviaesturariibacter aridisoli]|uniref:Uncharacterized protein n=1 Tax=Flaviaesturariibacter aridisoli TaxID=2545761 RepID=A0A4R4E028_9BACT|nr:hypothetical protein [Flaviaesturariibacter aridisoli]TCZ68387.1 hypothetical protein E0486_13980 [Flaviaesturariibacter aridisoli]
MQKELYTRLFTGLRDRIGRDAGFPLNSASLRQLAVDLQLYDALAPDLEGYFSEQRFDSLDLKGPALLSDTEDGLFLQTVIDRELTVPAFAAPVHLVQLTLSYDSNGLFSGYFSTAADRGPAFYVDLYRGSEQFSSCDQFSLADVNDLHEAVGAGALRSGFSSFLNTASLFTDIRVHSFEVASAGSSVTVTYDATPQQLQHLEVLPGILTLEDFYFTNTIVRTGTATQQSDLAYRFGCHARVQVCARYYGFSCAQQGGDSYRFEAAREGGVPLPTVPQLLGHFGLELPALDLFPEITLQSIAVTADIAQKKLEEVEIGAELLFRPLEARFRSRLSFPDCRYRLSLLESLPVAETMRRIGDRIGLPLPTLGSEFEQLQVQQLDVALSRSTQSFELQLTDLFSYEICGSTLRFERFAFSISHSTGEKPRVSIGGAVSFLDLLFSFRGSYDTHYTFEAVLETELTLKDYQQRFEQQFAVQLPFSLPNIGLSALSFACSTDKSFHFVAEMGTFSLRDLGIELELLQDLQVVAPSLEIAYDQQSKFFCEIRGGLTLKGLSFDLLFTRKWDSAAGKAGYYFYGELRNDYALGDLEYFSESFRTLIPDSVRDLTLKTLSVTYDSLEDHFLFTAEIQDLLHYDFELGVLRKIDVNDCRLQFHIRDKKIHFNLQGDLAINDTHLVFETDYSTEKGLTLAAYNKEVMNLNLKGFTDHYLGETGVWSLVPEYFRNITFDKTRLQFRSSPLQVSIDISTKQLGGLYGFIGKSRSGAGVLFGIVPPAKIPFSEINADLGFLEGLDFTGSFLVLSSADASSYEPEQIPEQLKTVAFVDGITLSAALSLNEEGIRSTELRAAVAYFRKHILDVQQLTIRGMLGLDLEKIALEAFVGKIAIGGTLLELRKAGVRISAGLDFTLFGTLAIDLQEYIGIAMSFSLYLKVAANGVMGYGIWEGDLGTRNLKELSRNLEHLSTSATQLLNDYEGARQVLASNTLFNPGVFHAIGALPELQVTRLGLIFGIDYEGIPSFGFLGEFTLNGTGDADKGIVAFVFDSANPSKCLLDLKFPRETQKALQDLFRQCNFLGIPAATLDGVLNFLQFGGFADEKGAWVPLRLKFAIADVRIGDVFYNKGIMVQGRIGLFGGELEAAFNLRLDSSGFKGFGKLKKIDIRIDDKPVLLLAESAESVLVKDRVLNEDINKLLFDGPYLNVEAPIGSLDAACINSSARVEFLGVQYDTLCSISRDGVYFKCNERLPVGQLQLDVALRSFRDMEATGSVNLDFEIPELYVSAQAQGHGGIYLKGTDLRARFSLLVSFKDPVNNHPVSLPAFDVELTVPPQLVDVLSHLAERTVETVREVAKEVFSEIKAELEQLVKEITALAEEIAAVARSIEEQTHIIATLKQNIEEIIDVLKAIYGAIAQHREDIARLERELLDLAAEIAQLADALARLDLRRTNDLINQIPNILMVIVLEIAGTTSAITGDVLLAVNRKLEDGWNYWEQVRIDTYQERMRLDAEYRDNWWKPWAWGHPARMGALLIHEGVCESNKFHERNLINLLAPFVELAAAIERDTRQVQNLLGLRRSEHDNKSSVLAQTQTLLAERMQKANEETDEQHRKEGDLRTSEGFLQELAVQKTGKESLLTQRREDLERIKSRKRAELAL